MTYTVPGAPPRVHRVDDDDEVVRLEQLVGQVDAADAEVADLDARPATAAGQPLHDLDAEAVVAFEDVAEPGHQDAHHASTRIGSTSSGAKYRKRPCGL